MIVVGTSRLLGKIWLRPERCPACGDSYLAAETAGNHAGILECVCGECRRRTMAAVWAAKVEAKQMKTEEMR